MICGCTEGCQSQKSNQQGGCWWLSTCLAPCHLQQSWWPSPVNTYLACPIPMTPWCTAGCLSPNPSESGIPLVSKSRPGPCCFSVCIGPAWGWNFVKTLFDLLVNWCANLSQYDGHIENNIWVPTYLDLWKITGEKNYKKKLLKYKNVILLKM